MSACLYCAEPATFRLERIGTSVVTATCYEHLSTHSEKLYLDLVYDEIQAITPPEGAL